MEFSNLAMPLSDNRMRSILARLFCYTPRSTSRALSSPPANSKGFATRSRPGSDRKGFFRRMSSSNQSKENGVGGEWKRVELEVDGKRVTFERFDREVLKSPNDNDRQYR